MNVSQDYSYNGLEVAVIGMAGKFPGANNVQQYWENLINGIESIKHFSDDELRALGVEEDLLKNPQYVKANGILENKYHFDSDFFKYTQTEASVMDPQMRMMHECVWEALENAGYSTEQYKGLIGLYLGASSSVFWESNMYLNGDYSKLGEFSSSFLANRDFAATNISYRLNLKGPSVMIQTACSTSLVAVHNACRALLTQDCDIAIAGGVSLGIHNRRGYLYEEGMVFSKDGHCRPFDEQADGTVPGDGIGVVVLKTLEKAIQDKDNIYAVIKGSAANNDGSSKAGYTAPGVEGQAEVIKMALNIAEIPSETISYIEAHGTGTALGDLVEVEALSKVFSGIKNSIALASVKSNVGHLDSASGIAALIKAVMAIMHKQIPRSLKFNNPNPRIDFDKTPFYVPKENIKWESSNKLRAGVSSFGIGGTNAHIILEESPLKAEEFKPESERKEQIILLSAKTANALQQRKKDLLQYLEENQVVNLEHLAYTLQTGRNHFKHRWFTTTFEIEKLKSQLTDNHKAQSYMYEARKERDLIFMFPGQGLQYVGIGRELYEEMAEFREEMDYCFHVLGKQGLSYIKEIMFPIKGRENQEEINRIDIAPLVTLVIEYCMAKFILKKGITPSCLIGHSIGEYVAACLSGALTFEDAVRLVSLRGKLMRKMPPGLMISVPLPINEIKMLINDSELSIAADHGSTCLVSGSVEAIEELINELRNRKIITQRLPISHAGHSEMLKDITQEFYKEVEKISFSPLKIPVVSTRLGKEITYEILSDPDHWTEHIYSRVEFASGIKTILQQYSKPIFIEVGPGNSLSRIVKQLEPEIKTVPMVKAENQPVSDAYYWRIGVGLTWIYGGKVNWTKFNNNLSSYKIPLPSYPFEHKAFPFKFAEKPNYQEKKRKQDHSDWYYVPTWKHSFRDHEVENIKATDTVVIFYNDSDFCSEFMKHRFPFKVLKVKNGEKFKNYQSREYEINPSNDQDFKLLMDDINKNGIIPCKFIVLWSINEVVENRDVTKETFDMFHELGFNSLINLAKTTNQVFPNNECRIVYVSNNVHSIQGEGSINPELATIMGPIQIIPSEYPKIKCSHIDISLNNTKQWEISNYIKQLADIIQDDLKDQTICLRGKHMFVRSFEQVRLDSDKNKQLIKDNGKYIITGGFGGIGYSISKEITSMVKEPHLYILQRNPFVENYENKINELKNKGARVSVYAVDLTNTEELAEVLEKIKANGSINGVIHCAGITDGKLIHNLTNQDVKDMFAAKVYGTINLDILAKDQISDFVIYCSSLNSFMSTIGTTAYTSANCFLDAYANYKSELYGKNISSINWFAWRETGGAVKNIKNLLDKQIGTLAVNQTSVTHPLIQKQIINEDDTIFVTNLSVEEHWVLKEHLVNGKALLPGTAYIELLSGVVRSIYNTLSFEIRDMYLMKPLIVEDTVDLRIVVKKHGRDLEFEFLSLKDGIMSQHSVGKLYMFEEEDKYMSIDVDFESVENHTHRGHVVLGPRWTRNLRGLSMKSGKVALYLELPEEFHAEIEDYILHPALMDTALATNHDNEFYPFYYKKIIIRDRLPEKIYSMAQYIEQESKDVQTYDYLLTDSNGKILVEIEEYTLVNNIEQNVSAIKKDKKKTDKTFTSRVVEDALKDGFSDNEGVDVFKRILGSNLAQVVTCPVDLESKLKGETNNDIQIEEQISNHLVTERPDLSTLFVSPQSELEYKIALVWQELLGIEKVGIHDNFFDLGATSLTLIQANRKIQDELRKSISIVTYYMYPTINQLSEYLSGSEAQKIKEHSSENKKQNKLGDRKKRLKR